MGEEDEKQGSQGCVGAKRGESPIILLSSWVGQGLLQCAEPFSLYPHLTYPHSNSARYMQTYRKCQFKHAEGSGHSVGGQHRGEEAPGRQKRLWGNRLLQFSPRRNRGQQMGSAPPLPHQRLVEPSHAGPLSPLTGLNFGLSKSQRDCFHRSCLT